MRSVLRGERVFGATLVGTGLFALYKANEFSLGNLREPDAGFFPVVVAVALIVFAVLAVTGSADVDKPRAEPGGVARVGVLIAVLAAYAWLMPFVGFVLCTVVLLGVLLRGLGGAGWPATLIGAIGGAVGCYLLFSRLGMPLPPGLLGF